jgi:V8-like Glu-specific endopeptidase
MHIPAESHDLHEAGTLDFEVNDLLHLHNLVDESDWAVIGPTDNRVQEIDTSKFPLNTVVHLCRDFPGRPCSGCSGTLIGPDTVLTAGHCLWNLSLKRAPDAIRVAPGRTGRNSLPFGTYTAAHYWVPKGFIDGPDRAIWDFGVIKLSRPVRHTRRFSPLTPLDNTALQDVAARRRVTVAGYPADRPFGTLWQHTERLKKATPRRVFYSVSTCPGHSGSAVTVDRGKGPEIIAVHTTGILDAQGRSYGCTKGATLAPSNLMNSGVRLTPDIVRAIVNPQWRGTGNAAMIALK